MIGNILHAIKYLDTDKKRAEFTIQLLIYLIDTNLPIQHLLS